MLTRKHLLNVITLGAPLLVSMVSEFFMYMADSAMVGRLGTGHLAAIGFATLFAEVLCDFFQETERLSLPPIP